MVLNWWSHCAENHPAAGGVGAPLDNFSSNGAEISQAGDGGSLDWVFN